MTNSITKQTFTPLLPRTSASSQTTTTEKIQKISSEIETWNKFLYSCLGALVIGLPLTIIAVSALSDPFSLIFSLLGGLALTYGVVGGFFSCITRMDLVRKKDAAEIEDKTFSQIVLADDSANDQIRFARYLRGCYRLGEEVMVQKLRAEGHNTEFQNLQKIFGKPLAKHLWQARTPIEKDADLRMRP